MAKWCRLYTGSLSVGETLILPKIVTFHISYRSSQRTPRRLPWRRRTEPCWREDRPWKTHRDVSDTKPLADNICLNGTIWKLLFDRIYNVASYEEAQPIRGFSQRSLVSKSIFHFLVLLPPDCMAVLVGTKMWTLRVLMCSSGTPVTALMSCRDTEGGREHSVRQEDRRD